MSIENHMEGLFAKAKYAAQGLLLLNSEQKNKILLAMADSIEKNSSVILAANSKDIVQSKLNESELDRLRLSRERVSAMACDVRVVAALPEPVGEESGWMVPNGLSIRRVHVPFGVIGAIYESRPNVTIDIASLCIKSGNAVILRGSSSALNSNRALLSAISNIVPEGAVQFVDSTDRAAVGIMMAARGKLDLLIPRGGYELIKRTVEESIVPVIETGTGNCHVFVDESADLKMAESIILNSKCQRPGVCNAQEKLLVHKSVAAQFIPKIVSLLIERGIEVRACEQTHRIVGAKVKLATEADWPLEYLDLIIAIKVVDSLEAAIAHINKYGSRHTEAIITENYTNSERFAKLVDAAAVNINASTRFTDGGQYGFGSEIGISTQKLHARGPMGLKALTTYKYVVHGNGQIRK